MERSLHFSIGRGAKAPLFHWKKKKGKGWNIKQRQDRERSKAGERTEKRFLGLYC
jgi:hypothetical protein